MKTLWVAKFCKNLFLPSDLLQFMKRFSIIGILRECLFSLEFFHSHTNWMESSVRILFVTLQPQSTPRVLFPSLQFVSGSCLPYVCRWINRRNRFHLKI